MPRSWWMKSAFVVLLVLLSFVGLVPTYVELVAYPEKPQEHATEDEKKEQGEPSKDDSADSNDAQAAEDTKDQDTEKGQVALSEEQRDPPLPSWYLWFQENITDQSLALGLDLQGGLLLRYSVDVDVAIDDKLSKFATDIYTILGERGVKGVDAYAVKDQDQVVIKFEDEDDSSQINDELMEDFPVLVVVSEDNGEVVLGLRDNYIQETEEYAVKQAVEIIRERVDALGVASPSVRVEGGRHVVVELPGLSSRRAAAAEKLISTTAVLTFRLIADAGEASALFAQLSSFVEEGSGISYEGGNLVAGDQVSDEGQVLSQGKDVLKAFIEKHEKDLPHLRQVVYERIAEETKQGQQVKTGPVRWRTRLVRTDVPALTGDNVDDAFPAANPNTNIPYVSLKLDKKGGDVFYEITKEYTGEQLAILMDDTLISDPVIRQPIPGGNVSIEMGGTNRNQIRDDVQNLVVALRSGALPAPIRQEFKTLVGPTLGRDSIESGTLALIIGSVLVLLFMLVYYKLGGVVANVALLLNLLFIIAIMAGLGSALTLPGIAGIVLTVGMAVDANVIIFERIREEVRAGETARKAVQMGYEKALWTILDANITTAIAALVLMEFGSGPVRGFAITLLIGIVCSVFTAIFVSRLIFDWYLSRKSVERLPI